MFPRKLVKTALQSWKRTDALGQHSLARLAIVEARRLAAGYPATPTGQGAALRDVLRDAIDAFRPDSGQPDMADDRWRHFIILTRHCIEGQDLDYLAGQLSIARSTLDHAQTEALNTLAANLWAQEHDAGHAEAQPAPKEDPPAPATPAPSPPPGGDPPLPSPNATRLSPRHRLLWPSGLLAALILVLAGLLWLRPALQPTGPHPVIATIPLGATRTEFIRANPTTRRVYVMQEDTPAIAVIDGLTNALLTTLPTEGYHRGLAVNPITNRVYVAQQFAGSVRVIDGATNTILTDLVVPDLVQTVGDLAINPLTNRLYVIRANNNDVAVFDATTYDFLAAVAFGPPSAPGCPIVACDSAGLAVNPATNRIYVANPISGQITVIDGAANRVLTTLAVDKSPNHMDINAVTNTLYVTHGAEGRVSVIDGTSHRVVATIPVERAPVGVVVNPSTNRVYVANSQSQSVSVIDGAANGVIGTVTVGVPAAFAAVLPSLGRLYVSGGDANTVKVIEDSAPPFSAWTPLKTTGGPPTARGDTAQRPLGYDAANNRVLFFGGMKQGGPLLNDTWVLADADGTTGTPQWIELATAQTPPPRRSHAGAYDAASNRLMTYGGCLGGCSPLDNQVYVLSHANGLGGAPTWQRLEVAGSPPPPRNGHSAVYDPVSNRLIVFGGDNCCGQRFNDTWVLTHANGLGGAPTWLPLTPSEPLPPGRVGHSAVYDTAHQRMFIFGGAATSSLLNDVWALDGASGVEGTPTWRQLTPTGRPPSARSGHSVIYDPDTDQMLFFGGSDGTALRNDTWVLSYLNSPINLPAWTHLRPVGTAPTARIASNAVYRAVTNRLVLLGGDTQSGSLNDTWLLVNAMPLQR